jgi:hypothetical protein
LNYFWEQTIRQSMNFYYFSQDLEVEVHQENEAEKVEEAQQVGEQVGHQVGHQVHEQAGKHIGEVEEDEPEDEIDAMTPPPAQNILKTCFICQKGFLNEKLLAIHKQVIHQNLCYICNLELESTRMQIDHMLKYHPENVDHIPFGEWHAGIFGLT